MDPDAAAAANAALLQFVREDWTLFSIGFCFTALRTFARVKQGGFKGLRADDFLVWIAMMFYAAETSLAYSVGAVAKGLANNGMSDEQRLSLDPSSTEYQTRITGSKIQLAGWSTYSALLWSLKASLIMFYTRLTAGLGRSYTLRIHIGFGFLLASYLAATLNLFLGCRPFNKYWQISPDPGNVCQPAISNSIVWVYGSLNIATDLYLISIPLPMLWKSSLKPLKKLGLVILFSGGLFIIVCALIRAIFIVTDPINGAQQAGSWAVRETFVAVITTNMPIVFPFVITQLTPVLGSLVQSVKGSIDKKSPDGTPRSLITWGGGGKQSWRGRGPRTPNPITDLTYTESEERMLNQGHIRMHEVGINNVTTYDHNPHGNNIRKDVDVAVTTVPREEENRQALGQGNFVSATALPSRQNL
ncbi:hypothetical protein F4818DRAFT_427419 [Hypoxylon cercidicola]|nr:hypothetical protein F4818DRAFT_427419 [Hypoxylon cercidicola]